MDIDLIVSISLILVGLGGGFVQRISGFGLGIFVMLFMPHFMPSTVAAVSVSCLFSCGTSTYNAVKYRKDTPYKTVLPVLIAAMVVIPFAVYFSASVPEKIFQILLGSILILLSIFFIFFSNKIHFKPSTTKGAIAGALGGALNGLFSTGGPPIVLYLSHATDDNKKYFAGTQFYFAITNVYATIMRAINGLITLELLIYACIGMVGCLIGDLFGKMIFIKLNGSKLKTVIYIGMIISGIIMII